MFRIVFLLCLTMSILPSFAQRTVTMSYPQYNNYYNSYNKNVNFRDLGDLELYVFDKTFCNENNLSRISRLEEAVFGTNMQGDIYQRYENLSNAIFSRPKQNFKTSLLRNLSNYFNGQMTGFTPDIYTNQQPSYYGNQSFVNYSGINGRGYYYNNYDRANSSSVRILNN